MSANVAVLIPAKSFTSAKLRLSSVLDDDGRSQLARALLTRTSAAVAGLGDVHVVSDSQAVLDFSTEIGLQVIRCSGPGLNLAVDEGVRALAKMGIKRSVVMHSDLPLIGDVSSLETDHGVLIVPDRRGQGTNIISIPTNANIRWSYGDGSLHRHRAAVLRLGLGLRLVRSASLGFDLDTPQDVADLLDLCAMRDRDADRSGADRCGADAIADPLCHILETHSVHTTTTPAEVA